ncbi:unnamed protein product [Rhodiola kirilowii]
MHFYVFSVVWNTTLLALTWHYAYKIAPLDSDSVKYMANHLTGGGHIFSLHKSHSTSVAERYRVWQSVLLLLLMDIQVVSRLYESLYVFKYSYSARNACHWLSHWILFLCGSPSFTLSRMCPRCPELCCRSSGGVFCYGSRESFSNGV